VVAADLEVDRVVPGVILSAPEPNSGSTRSSAITGHAPLDDGTTTSLPIASRVARVVRVHGTATSAGSSPAARRDRDRPDPSTNGLPGVGEHVVRLDVLDLEDRRSRSGGSGHQLTIRFAR
jgi:hypothetical protein